MLLDPDVVLTSAASQTTATHINMATLRTTNGLASQDGPYDPYSDPRLRNCPMSLEEKNRTMSSSGSFRDGLEEGETRRPPSLEVHVMKPQAYCWGLCEVP